MVLNTHQRLSTVATDADFTKYLSFIDSLPSVSRKGSDAHHILPRKEFPEYIDDPANLVYLTSANHLKAHYYLAIGAPSFTPFQRVFFFMTNFSKWAHQVGEEEMAQYSEVYERGRLEQRKLASKLGKKFAESGLLAKIRTHEGSVKGGKRGGGFASASGQIQKLGNKNVESGHLLSISSKGGKIGGRIAVESGRLKRGASVAGRLGGLVQGRKNAESGKMANIGRMFGPIHGRRWGKIQGKLNAESGQLKSIAASGAQACNHLRWHERREKVAPNCPLCKEGA